MAERKIPPTDGLEVYLNDGGSIVLVQEPPNDEKQFIFIHPRDIETVRQWLAELYLEATTGE